jgi:class 3 adenylate cyclase
VTSTPSRSVAILFADLGGSTQLYERLGDERGRRVTALVIEAMIAAVERCGGRVVKTIGDEVMATFEEPGAAADAAAAIVSGLREEAEIPEEQLGVHVGLHWGPVIEEDDDVFGDAVNVASRMVGLAKSDEILTTRALVDALDPKRGRRARCIDRLPVKGKRELLEVFELTRPSSELTMLGVQIPQIGTAGHLVLECGGNTFTVDDQHPSLTLGRAAENELVLYAPWVSRRHARIKLRQGLFVLFDESSNGTFVRDAHGETVRVHRDHVTLDREGRIGAGGAPEGDTDLPIAYRIESRG